MSGEILIGDCRDSLKSLPDQSVHCVVTSPPYFGLRDYGVDGQIGRENTPDAFVAAMVEVFREVRRVLRDDGTLWLNLGDSYSSGGRKTRDLSTKGTDGLRRNKGVRGCDAGGWRPQDGFKPKDRLMIPARTAIALHADGWYLRDEIIWHKPRTTPAPVKDRTVAAHEMMYLFSKSPRYHFDYLAIEEPSKYAGVTRESGKAFRDLQDSDPNAARKRPGGREIVVRDTRRKRSVWSVSPSPYKDAHFATYPPDLIEPCILAGCPEGGTVLDPFFGAGTTGLVAERLGRNWIGCELNPAYAEIAERRIARDHPMLSVDPSLLLWALTA